MREAGTTPRRRCAVCGGAALESVVDLPALPLTGIFVLEHVAPGPSVFDQQLVRCGGCGHAQLGTLISPDLLYDSSYSFRSSTSATARHGTEVFLGALEQLAPQRRFECVVDVGCNDLHLLRRLEGRGRVRVGIDPILATAPATDAEGIVVIGTTVEETDLPARLGQRPDLVVCRHTLEHIAEPLGVLATLWKATTDDAVFVFEVPSFEALVGRFRFDHVFHQHLHYFTRGSLARLVETLGGAFIGAWENYHDWGAMILAFAKRGGKAGATVPPALAHVTATSIRGRYDIFRRQLSVVRDVLASLPAPVFGYGAGQMVPVLAYHLGSDLSELSAIVDDDPAKDGLRYPGLAAAIRHTAGVALKDASVVITAVDNAQPIMTKLLGRRPRHIVYPLSVI